MEYIERKDIVVYRHLKPNGEVFYIGIGKPNRPFDKRSRNPHWYHTVNKYGYEVQILKSNLSWEEACELETILIEYYGRKDLNEGTLVNLTPGGDYNPYWKGKKLSQEHKNNIGKAGLGRKLSDYAKEQISKAQRGRLRTDAEKESHSKKVKGKNMGLDNYNSKLVLNTETGIFYDTLKEASLSITNISYKHLSRMLNGTRKNKTTLKYC